VRRSRISADILLFITILAASVGLCRAEVVPPSAETQGAEGMDVLGTGVSPTGGPGALEGTIDPQSYVLGVGDGLAIGFWGEVNRHEVVYVNPEGDVLIVPVGPIKVDGLTLAEARDLIRDKLSPYYTPAILSVSLSSVRTFQIHVVGMVAAPGAYEANAVTRVSQVVSSAGGLLEGASHRNIEIRRPAGPVRADLTRYLLLGDNSMNPFLRDGDVVYVPPEVGLVRVFGSVYREGPYEYVEGEDLADLIELAGGYTPGALTDSVEVQRFSTLDPTEWRLLVVPGDAPALESFFLELDDNVFVRSIPDWHDYAHVVVKGQVKYPGRYAVDEGVEVLSEVLNRAGGITLEASLAQARLIRGKYAAEALPPEAEVDAIAEAGQTMSWKEKDLYKVLSREPKGLVSVSLAELYTAREEPFDPVLYDGDIIEIPRATNMVRVMGHVVSPGLLPIAEGQYSNYYIRKAGGYASLADKRGTRVIRAGTGQRVKTGNAVIHAGDIIWVPDKKERDGWETFRDVVSVVAQIATIFLVIDTASK
jgi:protein involved in polysaccharide export with SLBB domain